jgi:hypothetical protein
MLHGLLFFTSIIAKCATVIVAPEVNKISVLTIGSFKDITSSAKGGHWLPFQYLDLTTMKVAQKNEKKNILLKQ